jgi:hypothetical protein
MWAEEGHRVLDVPWRGALLTQQHLTCTCSGPGECRRWQLNASTDSYWKTVQNGKDIKPDSQSGTSGSRL